jgi:hypothetical protein
MGAQPAPDASQRSHPRWRISGRDPTQVGSEPVRVAPSRAGPEAAAGPCASGARSATFTPASAGSLVSTPSVTVNWSVRTPATVPLASVA